MTDTLKVKIPKDDGEARDLADVAYLNGWALAGYVASQIHLNDGPGQPKSIVSSDNTLSIVQFAAKGIRGLRSHNTVRLYAKRWLDAGLPIPLPGEVVEIPDELWPPAKASELEPEPVTPDPVDMDTPPHVEPATLEQVEAALSNPSVAKALYVNPLTAAALSKGHGQALAEKAFGGPAGVKAFDAKQAAKKQAKKKQDAKWAWKWLNLAHMPHLVSVTKKFREDVYTIDWSERTDEETSEVLTHLDVLQAMLNKARERIQTKKAAGPESDLDQELEALIAIYGNGGGDIDSSGDTAV